MISAGSVLAAIAVLVASTISAFALESTLTARSSLSQEALWQAVSDFCAMTLWNPAVEDCVLSPDGRVRTLSLFVGGKFEQVLENWDSAGHSYAYTGAPPLPVANFHSKVRVIAEGERIGAAINRHL